MTRYVGLIDGEAGAYGIVFPDLPGCTSMGGSIEEAIANGADALRLWVEVTEEKNGTVPAPRAFEAMRGDEDVKSAFQDGATVVLVPLIRVTGRSVKANLSIDAGVLAAIDEEAARRKLTRVGFIEVMAREMLPRMAR